MAYHQDNGSQHGSQAARDRATAPFLGPRPWAWSVQVAPWTRFKWDPKPTSRQRLDDRSRTRAERPDPRDARIDRRRIRKADVNRAAQAITDLSVDLLPRGVHFQYGRIQAGSNEHVCLVHDRKGKLLAVGQALSRGAARLRACRELQDMRRGEVSLGAGFPPA